MPVQPSHLYDEDQNNQDNEDENDQDTQDQDNGDDNNSDSAENVDDAYSLGGHKQIKTKTVVKYHGKEMEKSKNYSKGHDKDHSQKKHTKTVHKEVHISTKGHGKDVKIKKTKEISKKLRDGDDDSEVGAENDGKSQCKSEKIGDSEQKSSEIDQKSQKNPETSVGDRKKTIIKETTIIHDGHGHHNHHNRGYYPYGNYQNHGYNKYGGNKHQNYYGNHGYGHFGGNHGYYRESDVGLEPVKSDDCQKASKNQENLEDSLNLDDKISTKLKIPEKISSKLKSESSPSDDSSCPAKYLTDEVKKPPKFIDELHDAHHFNSKLYRNHPTLNEAVERKIHGGPYKLVDVIEDAIERGLELIEHDKETIDDKEHEVGATRNTFTSLCENLNSKNSQQQPPQQNFMPMPFTAPYYPYPVTGESTKATSKVVMNPGYNIMPYPVCFVQYPHQYRAVQPPYFYPTMMPMPAAGGAGGGGNKKFTSSGSNIADEFIRQKGFNCDFLFLFYGNFYFLSLFCIFFLKNFITFLEVETLFVY